MRLLLGVILAALLGSAGTAATATAAHRVVSVNPGKVNFGAKSLESFSLKSTTIRNTSDEPILLTLTLVRSWDDFSGGWITSTCFDATPLAPGESCTLVEGFSPSETFLGIKQDQVWLATATDPESGAVLTMEEIIFLGRAR